MRTDRATYHCGCVVEREHAQGGLASVQPCAKHRKDPVVFAALLELKRSLEVSHVRLRPIDVAIEG